MSEKSFFLRPRLLLRFLARLSVSSLNPGPHLRTCFDFPLRIFSATPLSSSFLRVPVSSSPRGACARCALHGRRRDGDWGRPRSKAASARAALRRARWQVADTALSHTRGAVSKRAQPALCVLLAPLNLVWHEMAEALRWCVFWQYRPP
eukprot:5826326-Pleurochrysis_carterae.AAC.7